MKNILLLLLILLTFHFVTADIVSINSGGSEEIIVNSNNYIGSFFTCIPSTCASLGYTCGSWSDGCAGTLSCGSCASGYTCSSGTCTSTSTGPSGGGGGGGSSLQIKKELTDLKIIPDNFNIASITNSTLTLKIDLSNIGNSDLNIITSLTNSLKNIISLQDPVNFNLPAGELKTLNFQVKSPSKAGIYTGKIIFTSQGKSADVPFVLNIYSGINLFDVSLDIAEKYRIVNQGDKIKGQINLIQKGLQEQMDVSIYYIVKDYEDNVYIEESETLMVHEQKSYEHEFNTKDLSEGEYILGVEVIYEGGVATASYPFKISDEKITGTKLIYIILAIIFLLAIISILLIIKHYKQLKSKI